MNRPPPTAWNDVAIAKLTRVLGEKPGRDLMTATLGTLGVEEISSADQLRDFAMVLSSKGGFAAALGALLSVHAATYGAPASTPDPQAAP